MRLSGRVYTRTTRTLSGGDDSIQTTHTTHYYWFLLSILDLFILLFSILIYRYYRYSLLLHCLSLCSIHGTSAPEPAISLFPPFAQFGPQYILSGARGPFSHERSSLHI